MSDHAMVVEFRLQHLLRNYQSSKERGDDEVDRLKILYHLAI